jgi:predicted nucleic acid-binding protein
VKLLLDINVVLDVLLAREPWGRDASRLFAMMPSGRVEAYVAGHAVTTAHYIMGRAVERSTALTALADLLRIVDVVPVSKTDFIEAMALEFRDIEDAVQAVCALKVGAEVIVTRDAGDFAGFVIPAIPPAVVVARLGP